MQMPNEYDEYTVYVPHTQVTDDTGPTLDEVLLAGYKALGLPMEDSWIETSFRDTHGI